MVPESALALNTNVMPLGGGLTVTDSMITLIGIGIQTALIILGGYAVVIRNDTKQQVHTDELRQDMSDMREELKKLSEVVIVQAIQTTRLDNLTTLLASVERRVEDLRRGNGFVISSDKPS